LEQISGIKIHFIFMHQRKIEARFLQIVDRFFQKQNSQLHPKSWLDFFKSWLDFDRFWNINFESILNNSLHWL